MNTEKAFEIPDYASPDPELGEGRSGSRSTSSSRAPTQYYGDFTFGGSPWLDSMMGITDYGHRSVPNVILGAPLLSDGTWNSAHFKNPTYDNLVKQYNAASDVQSQQKRRQADPGAAAGRDADHLRLLLRLPGRHRRERRRRRDHAHRPRPAGGRRLHLLTTHARRRPGAGGGTSRRPRWHGFILRRIGLALITLWLLSVLVFFLVQLLPGNVGPLDPRPARRAVARSTT